MVLSIGIPYGRSSSSCGYCSPPGERSAKPTSRHTAGLAAMQLSCEVYQGMIDRGWRRSGTWCYKPDLRASCCPQYPIRQVGRFKVQSFAQPAEARQSVRVITYPFIAVAEGDYISWNRFVEHGKGQDTSKNAKQKGKNTTDFDLIEHVHASEHYFGGEKDGWARRFEIVLEPSSFTNEKYELFEKYQTNIHHDKSTRSGFKRFLVESPLRPEPIPYPSPPDPQRRLPTHYGSHHQLYRLDGKLIAMAVLDILPSCVSSVYFMYDDDWDEFSLGKISALREISLASEVFSAGAPGLKFLYLGYYIHTCQKMRYKGDYQPSFVCDPESYSWYSLEQCRPLFDANIYACFSNPDNSRTGPPDDDTEEEFDSYSPSELGPELMSELLAVDHIAGSQLFVKSLDESMPTGEEREELLCCIEGLGIPLAKKMVFYLRSS